MRRTYLVGLIGAGIEPSLTPTLHEHEAAALGLPYVYRLIDIDAAGLTAAATPGLVKMARLLRFDGLNVTHPCKQAVIGALDDLSPEAEVVGAVNTVVIRGDRATGHNTDWSGFAHSLRRGLPGASLGHVVVLGAGGAGAAVCYALGRLGAQRVTVIDTDEPRAAALAASLAPVFGARRIEDAPGSRLLPALAHADGLVHATPTGMADHPGMAVPAGALAPPLWVADVVYRPLATELVAAARAAGCRTLDGGAMAVFQAAEAFRLFTGAQPDVDRMLADFGRLTAQEAGDARLAGESARRRCIATVCLGGPLEERLAAAAAAGFDGVEVFTGDLSASARPASHIGVLARDLGLSVEMYQPFRDAEGAPPGRFGSVARRMRAALDVAAALGAPMLLVCSSVAPDTIDDDDLAAGQLCALADLAAERGLRLAYEALAWGRHVRTWQRSWDIVARADHRALGLCLDSFHVLARNGAPGGIASLPGDRIFFLQLADAPAPPAAGPRTAADIRRWSRHRRLFPLQGDFDLLGFARAVCASGYAGPLSLEVFNDEFRRADPRRTAAGAMRSLLRLENAVRGAAA